MNEIQSAIARIPKARKVIAICIMFGSIFGVFFTGFYFDLFDSKIDFVQKPSGFLFFGFMLSGLFGLFYVFQPISIAVKNTVKVTFLFFAVALVGKLIRGEF